MHITVQCSSEGAEGGLRSLTQWLAADPGVRRHVEVTPGSAAPARPGQQGDLVDLVSLVLGSGFSAASLALSVANWRATRPQPPTLVVERADGVKVQITGHSSQDTEEMIRRVLGA